ncbi:MAG: sulfatase-like hydrolase/transferase, partial [Geminicoccaceae bacterium]|nr:sulfatase-like hydrolase/transferase [Geminicoccaceae bacterium]
MTPSNVLFIMSDEHSRRHLGAYDDTFVRTPSMDALAAQGTLFENAYCNCPICVPS